MTQDPVQLENIHEHYMRMALQQAHMAEENSDVPVGCIIVHNSPSNPDYAARIIGKAHNQVEMLKDPSAHAEMLAITQAASALGDWRLLDTVLYVTKEPCVMCAGAIVLARIPVVVYGAFDTQRGAISLFNILDNKRLNHRCEIISGVLESECADVLRHFFIKQRSNE